MPKMLIAFMGLVEGEKSKGWGIRIRIGTISVRIPIRLSESRPNCAIVFDVDRLVMQNNATSGGQNNKKSMRSTNNSTRKLQNTIMATTIPIMCKAYVRALQRHSVMGESAKWPPRMEFEVGKIVLGVKNCEVNHWIGYSDFEGLDFALSLDGRWLDDETSQRPWPLNLPPLVSCCVTIGMMRLRGLSSSSSFELVSFLNNLSHILEPEVERKKDVDRVVIPEHLRDTSVSWNTVMSYFTNALSDIIRINRFAIVTHPNNCEKKEKLPPFLGVFLFRAIGFECKAPLLTKAQMFRLRTNGPIEICVHSFASHEQRKDIVAAESPIKKKEMIDL